MVEVLLLTIVQPVHNRDNSESLQAGKRVVRTEYHRNQVKNGLVDCSVTVTICKEHYKTFFYAVSTKVQTLYIS
jgi:hypothetical protein